MSKAFGLELTPAQEAALRMESSPLIIRRLHNYDQEHQSTVSPPTRQADPMPPNDYPHRHSTSTRKQRKARKAERQNRKKNRR